MQLTPEWERYRFSDDDRYCELCGQKQPPGQRLCPGCTAHSNGIILFTCRSFLYQWGEAVPIEQRDVEPGSTVNEKALGCVLNHFPSHLGSLVQKNTKSLMSAGAWFAHAMAFRFCILSFSMQNNPARLGEMNEFVQTRRIFFEALSQVNSNPQYPCQECGGNYEETREPEKILRDGFQNPIHEANMLCCVLEIIKDHEKSGKLKIAFKNASSVLETRFLILRSGGIKSTNNHKTESTSSHQTDSRMNMAKSLGGSKE